MQVKFVKSLQSPVINVLQKFYILPNYNLKDINIFMLNNLIQPLNSLIHSWEGY